MAQPRIQDLLDGRDNNFNLIRFLAAIAVIYDHSFKVVHGDGVPWLIPGVTTGDFGWYAVNVFFVLSGFLIIKSWFDRPDLLRFFEARVLRIVPALIAVSLATAFVIGPLVTASSPAGYFADLRTWLYAPLTSTFISDSATLPGVFETLPAAGVMNAPLWTLKYEVVSYGLVAVLGGLALLASRKRGLAVLVGLLAVYLIVQLFTDLRDASPAIDCLMRFWLCFFLGAGFYLLRDKIALNAKGVLVLALLAAFAYGTPFIELTSQLALAYAVLWFALVPAGVIRRFNDLGDYSYGLYISAWPLQQIAILLAPDLAPHHVFVLVTPIILLVAMASWHWVERPALSARGLAAQWTARYRRRGAESLSAAE